MALATTKTVLLIDYGSGNLRSAEKALVEAGRRIGSPLQILVSDDAEAIESADRLVLPGVGAFAACIAALRDRPALLNAITRAATIRRTPFLGICVGMQLLATRGLEFGSTPGLGWIDGDVVRLNPDGIGCKVPHVGWNALALMRPHPLLAKLSPDPQMYFTHSFHLVARQSSEITASVDHGGMFTAMVVRDNIAGVQFHPEKSQDAGLRLLANFLEWLP